MKKRFILLAAVVMVCGLVVVSANAKTVASATTPSWDSHASSMNCGGCEKKAECPKSGEVQGECPKNGEAKGECPKDGEAKGECPKAKGECPNQQAPAAG